MPILTRRIFQICWGFAPDPTADCAAYQVECLRLTRAPPFAPACPGLGYARCRVSLRYRLRLRDWTELLDYSTELKASRKPRKSIRNPGVIL